MDTKSKSLEPTKATAGKQSNGWGELVPLLDPAVVDAPHNKNTWQQLEPETVTWLVNTVSKFPWFNHLALVGVVHIEDANPAHQIEPLQSLHSFLRWAVPNHYSDVASLEPCRALIAYFGAPPTQRGGHAYKAYSSLQLYMERYLESSPTKQAILAQFLLPRLANSKQLRKLKGMADDISKQKRKEQAFAIVRELPAIVAMGRKHYKWLADLETQYQGVADAVRQGQATLPATIKCKDLSNQKEITFRVWDRRSWIKTHPDAYSKNALTRETTNERGLFLQLVGEMLDSSWFLRAIDADVFQGPNSPSPQAQRYLQEWRLPYPCRLQPGLLDPVKAIGFTLAHAKRVAVGTPDDSRVIFCVEPLLAGTAVGLFVLVCLVQTGMRIGELMQVTLDRECIESGSFPHFSDESGTWVKGPEQVYFRLYPKGSEKRERYLVTDQMLEALKILIDLHERYYGKDSIKPVTPRVSSEFSHSRRFMGKHKFVLQWHGQQIQDRAIAACLDFLLLEHPCRNPDGTPVRITFHVLRHGIAGWLRSQGIPLDDIMALLKQVNIAVTDYYSKLSPQDLYAKVGPALTALAELAEVDPSTIRTAGDIQKLAQDALKRYGVLRHTAGGTCSVFTPCEVQFRCASCPAFVPDPTRRNEVDKKIAGCQKVIQLFEAEEDHLRADVEKAHLCDWQRIEKEMDALSTVELVSPSTNSLLDDLGRDSAGDELLQNLVPQRRSLSEGNGTYA